MKALLRFAQRGQGVAKRRDRWCCCMACGHTSVCGAIDDFYGVDEQPFLCNTCLCTPAVHQQWRKPKVRVVAGLLAGNDFTYLVGLRSHGRFKDCWEFPGGKIEKGETPQGALKREWREELGMDILVLNPVSAWACPAWQITLFRIGAQNPPKMCGAHSDLERMSLQAISQLSALTPSMQPLLRHL